MQLLVTGTIKTITDFGIFVGLENELDGLVHMSDISWEADNETALRQYKKGANIELAEGIEGYLKVSDISIDRFEDASTALKVGEEVEAKIVNLDRRNRSITLSIKAKDQADEKAAIKAVSEKPVETAGPTTIGDLIKAQMASKK